ncbi:MAG: hypothetical protein RR100_24905 [Comamonas sp.]
MIESKVSSFRVMEQQRAIMAQCALVLRAACRAFCKLSRRLRAYSINKPVDNFVGKRLAESLTASNVKLV